MRSFSNSLKVILEKFAQCAEELLENLAVCLLLYREEREKRGNPSSVRIQAGEVCCACHRGGPEGSMTTSIPVE